MRVAVCKAVLRCAHFEGSLGVENRGVENNVNNVNNQENQKLKQKNKTKNKNTTAFKLLRML